MNEGSLEMNVHITPLSHFKKENDFPTLGQRPYDKTSKTKIHSFRARGL